MHITGPGTVLYDYSSTNQGIFSFCALVLFGRARARVRTPSPPGAAGRRARAGCCAACGPTGSRSSSGLSTLGRVADQPDGGLLAGQRSNAGPCARVGGAQPAARPRVVLHAGAAGLGEPPLTRRSQQVHVQVGAAGRSRRAARTEYRTRWRAGSAVRGHGRARTQGPTEKSKFVRLHERQLGRREEAERLTVRR